MVELQSYPEDIKHPHNRGRGQSQTDGWKGMIACRFDDVEVRLVYSYDPRIYCRVVGTALEPQVYQGPLYSYHLYLSLQERNHHHRGWNGMGHTHIVPRLLLAPAAPVTPAEFVNSLLSAWKVSKCSHLSQSIGK